MRYFLAFALLTALALPAYAQDEGAGVAEPAADVLPQANPEDVRTQLATRMHEIWPVSTRVEDAINVVAEDVPPAEREAFKARMRKAIDQETLKRESIAAMAKTFTVPELQAMVDFYGSPEGRAVSAKTDDYMALLQPIMVKMLDSALMKMRAGEKLPSSTPSP